MAILFGLFTSTEEKYKNALARMPVSPRESARLSQLFRDAFVKIPQMATGDVRTAMVDKQMAARYRLKKELEKQLKIKLPF